MVKIFSLNRKMVKTLFYITIREKENLQYTSGTLFSFK